MNSMIYLSYLMGASQISDEELRGFGVSIEETKPDGDRCLKMTGENLQGYIQFMKEKLGNGFWNEIVGEKEIIFIFKLKDGTIREYRLSPENEKEVDTLCAELNNEPPEKTANVYKYISANKFYHDFMMDHYRDLINR